MLCVCVCVFVVFLFCFFLGGGWVGGLWVAWKCPLEVIVCSCRQMEVSA